MGEVWCEDQEASHGNGISKFRTKHPLFLILRNHEVKAVVQENLVERQSFGKRLWESVEPMEAKFNGRRPDRETKPVLLLWDDFSAHWTEEVVAYATSINVVLARIPPTLTWICQPADVAWNRPLKSRLRDNWIDLLR
ncbi:hypothetical protein DYB36_013600 [Aphanomyces astaci]|uniref:DDE-1 domain-containing protein n=1 Tax=Aphanomyces astaci TaxID=112090 RepID=A0A397A102_APHAT|nr:hypothetical protein DYB36_013600 [Aphanomyces astaci]